MERAPALCVSRQGWTLGRQELALEEIFARNADLVYRFLYSRLGNREDAEDLTSEVFLKASRRLDVHRTDTTITAWLFTVARTVLADHWRRYYRARTPLPLDDTNVEAVADEPEQPESSELAARRVAAVLDRLPDRYRRVLELRFLYGYSIRETAEAMGITPENAKMVQHRAMAKAVRIGEGLVRATRTVSSERSTS